MDVGVLLYHLETHPGIVVLITNQPAAIDKAFHRRIRWVTAQQQSNRNRCH